MDQEGAVSGPKTVPATVPASFLDKIVLITGDMTERGKPYPDPYIRAMQELKLGPNECQFMTCPLEACAAGGDDGFIWYFPGSYCITLHMPSFKTAIDPQVFVYRRLAPWQRLAAACQLYQFAREIIAARIKRNNPSISQSELEKKIRSQL